MRLRESKYPAKEINICSENLLGEKNLDTCHDYPSQRDIDF